MKAASVLTALVAAVVAVCPAHVTTKSTKGPHGAGLNGVGTAVCTGPKPQQYVFHLSDQTCGLNDPNGPFYDSVHGVYHSFYQEHLAVTPGCNQRGCNQSMGIGKRWGHWVSRDFLHWARLPVAIWNDKWYDDVAVFSGSATIVDGKPVIVYDGVCSWQEKCLSSPTQFTYNVAVPANASDPFYTEWSKPSYNPIVNGTGGAMSTAWQTKDGEWRFIGKQACKSKGGNSLSQLYGSKDFKGWYKLGCAPLPDNGDDAMPTLFPLPPLTPGSDANLSDAQRTALPNYVHKAGDYVQVGAWADTAHSGAWEQVGNSTPLDNGNTHAATDFWDPVKNRRIMWVWVTLTPGGLMAIPRALTYDPRLQKIVYAPVEEMHSLRSPTPLGTLGGSTLGKAGGSIKVSPASNMVAVFAMPADGTAIMIEIDNGGGMVFANRSGSTMHVGFQKSAAFADVTNSTYTHEPKMKDGGPRNGGGNDAFQVLPSDTELSIEIFLDHGEGGGTPVGEAYWQGGRVAMAFGTARAVPGPWATAAIISDGPAKLINATSWQMSSIWVTKERVMATPRKDSL